ncbi:MAG: T9SS type A sorting domain-containing protein [Bacteroidales bacterium]|nr:T9SS type A sorting domain-containing protein [Bacteroidales bacterium]
MKKHLLSLIVLLTVAQSVSAQVNDTIYGRSPNYYYYDWYDECERYYQPYTDSYFDRVCLFAMGNFDEQGYVGRYQHTQRRLLIKGLSAMLSIDYMAPCSQIPLLPLAMGENRLPEYMYLYQHDTVQDSLILLDSIRWDTAAPKIMKLPKNNDTSAGFLYCEAYEVMFKEPHVVSGSFFIAGSGYSNGIRWTNPPSCPYKATMYIGIGLANDPCRFSPKEPNVCCWLDYYGYWFCVENLGYGPFHAIIIPDSSLLEVESADEEMGTVTGGGIFYDSTTYNIEAVPNVGYKFTHWNDGDTTNPRAVYLTQDTLFTAYFAPREQYEVVAVSNDLARGSVYGGGVYYEEDTATLTARAWGANVFARWDDGDTSNPRQVEVTQDTVFTALFSNPEGIGEVQGAAPSLMKIVPNPTDGKVSVILSVPLTGEVWVTLQDAAGHEVMSTHIPTGQSSVTLSLDHLPSGSYYATLHYPDGTATEKIVLK